MAYDACANCTTTVPRPPQLPQRHRRRSHSRGDWCNLIRPVGGGGGGTPTPVTEHGSNEKVFHINQYNTKCIYGDYGAHDVGTHTILHMSRK